MPWDAIKYVGSGLTLAAFIIAVIAWILKTKSEERAKLIDLAKEDERADLVRNALEFFAVDTAGLTKTQQYQLALEQIRGRAQRFKILALVVCFVAVLGAMLAIYALKRSSDRVGETADPKSRQEGAPGVVATNTPSARVGALTNAARLQLEAGDYAGAWKMISDAVSHAPDSKEVRNQQVEIALIWLRNMRVTLPVTFTETVQPLLECLYVALAQETGSRAADVHAHIGWANYLKWKDGLSGQKIEEEYAQAVRLDDTNPYARAMWGLWLAMQRKPLVDIRNQFSMARKSGRALDYVVYLQIYALSVNEEDLEHAADMVRLADELRRKGIDPGEEARNKIFDVVYTRHGRKHDSNVVMMLPAAEHLATFLWVAQNRRLNDSGPGAYFHARLTEAAGDQSKALSLYHSINKELSLFKNQIEAGIARCEKSLSAR
jgi:hypothetical protein